MWGLGVEHIVFSHLTHEDPGIKCQLLTICFYLTSTGLTAHDDRDTGFQTAIVVRTGFTVSAHILSILWQNLNERWLSDNAKDSQYGSIILVIKPHIPKMSTNCSGWVCWELKETFTVNGELAVWHLQRSSAVLELFQLFSYLTITSTQATITLVCFKYIAHWLH